MRAGPSLGEAISPLFLCSADWQSQVERYVLKVCDALLPQDFWGSEHNRALMHTREPCNAAHSFTVLTRRQTFARSSDFAASRRFRCISSSRNFDATTWPGSLSRTSAVNQPRTQSSCVNSARSSFSGFSTGSSCRFCKVPFTLQRRQPRVTRRCISGTTIGRRCADPRFKGSKRPTLSSLMMAGKIS